MTEATYTHWTCSDSWVYPQHSSLECSSSSSTDSRWLCSIDLWGLISLSHSGTAVTCTQDPVTCARDQVTCPRDQVTCARDQVACARDQITWANPHLATPTSAHLRSAPRCRPATAPLSVRGHNLPHDGSAVREGGMVRPDSESLAKSRRWRSGLLHECL